MKDDFDQIADALNNVYRGMPPIAPVREHASSTDVETAYGIQEINTRRWLGEGRKLTGRKIGLTSEAVQQQLGVDQPDYGMLFDDMAVDDGDIVPFASVSQAKIEGEIAFVLGADLDTPDLTIDALVDAIDYASPALEIVGSRIRNWDITIFDTIADNASSGMYVLGQKRVALSALDLVGCEMTLTEDSSVVSTGSGAACLGNPLNAALWLAQKMVEAGRPLQAGDIIMSGALGPFVDVRPGSRYRLSVAGLGTVSVGFGDEKE